MDGESIPSILGMVSYGGAAAIAVTVLLLVHVYNNSLLLKSERIRKKLQVQGVRGPPPSLLYGNLNQMHKIQSRASSNSKSAAVPHNHHDCVAHDYTSSLFPYFEQWRREYGPLYTYSTGMTQHLYVNEPEIVKEMNQSMALDLGKPSYVTKRLAPMLGNGILRANGLAWAQQRKIVAPEFYMDKVKGMVGLMVESAQPLLRKWEECIEAKGAMAAEIEVDEDLRAVSADVISRACFGSSYSKGKQIFSKLRTLQKLISKQNFLFGANHIFGCRGFLPTKKQKDMRNLETEIETLIWDAVREREQECCQDTTFPEKDLMQLILEGAIRDQSLGKVSSKSFIVDNCKNIYFAGHETTAVAASWCLMLLALHPEWQDRIRLELGERVTNEGTLSADSMLHLKSVTMVIHEVLRLYPPAAFVSREALEDTKIGNIVVPKGVCLWTLIPNLHRNQEIWGEDANEFKPERFSGGVSKACKCPQAYIPFGIGPRLCLGRNFAISQLKILISLIVSKFKFSLSPNYKHNPAYRLIVEPGYGVCIMVQKI